VVPAHAAAISAKISPQVPAYRFMTAPSLRSTTGSFNCPKRQLALADPGICWQNGTSSESVPFPEFFDESNFLSGNRVVASVARFVPRRPHGVEVDMRLVRLASRHSNSSQNHPFNQVPQ